MFFKRKKLLIINTININIRKTLIKTLVWSVALYDLESYTAMKDDRRKLKFFEMWCWRRVLRICWIERVKNEGVVIKG